MSDAEKSFTEKVNQLGQFADFIQTWAYKQLMHCPNDIIALFTGNQSMKTASVAYKYVIRIMGFHPVPKKNVLYFECQKRADLQKYSNKKNKGMYYSVLADYLKEHKTKDSATFTIPFEDMNGNLAPTSLPPDNKCPECGAEIVIHKRKTRIFRFASEKLPTEKDDIEGDSSQSAEIKNPQYPEFKKWLPPWMIRKDITVRNPAMTILDPNAGCVFNGMKYIGADVIVEFVSFSQQVAAGAGVQRLSCWIDESCPFDFYEEQIPRLLAEDGDIVFTLTPAIGLNWEYDGLFERACKYIRTKAICEFLSTPRKAVEQIEETDSEHDIVVIQAATDDNPTLSPDVIDKMFNNIVDPDGTVVATRRYGIFKQATGRIFKDYTYRVHVIDPAAYGISPETVSSWNLARTEDFHKENAHAIVWVAMSPQDEAFVYLEWSPSPARWVTKDICEGVAKRSGMDRFVCNLIDPLANERNPETSKTTIETINKHFYRLKHEGIGSGGFWQPYKTKGEVGRDEIKMRLANALKCEAPFNNKTDSGDYLPTLWVFENCPEVSQSLHSWRTETWANNRQLVTKDKKETPAQKWSHYCTALEGLFKDKRFRAKRDYSNFGKREPKRYFQGRAA